MQSFRTRNDEIYCRFNGKTIVIKGMHWDFEFVNQWTGWITGAIGTISAWLLGSKKRKRDDQQTQIDNLMSTFNAYKEIVSDLRKQVTELVGENKKLEVENVKLHNEIRDIRLLLKKYVSGQIDDKELKDILK